MDAMTQLQFVGLAVTVFTVALIFGGATRSWKPALFGTAKLTKELEISCAVITSLKGRLLRETHSVSALNYQIAVKEDTELVLTRDLEATHLRIADLEQSLEHESTQRTELDSQLAVDKTENSHLTDLLQKSEERNANEIDLREFLLRQQTADLKQANNTISSQAKTLNTLKELHDVIHDLYLRKASRMDLGAKHRDELQRQEVEHQTKLREMTNRHSKNLKFERITIASLKATLANASSKIQELQAVKKSAEDRIELQEDKIRKQIFLIIDARQKQTLAHRDYRTKVENLEHRHAATFEKFVQEARDAASQRANADMTLKKEREHIESLKHELQQALNTVDDERTKSATIERERDSARETLEAKNECTICYDSERNCLILPCRHVSTCCSCAEQLERCPRCTVPIDKTIRFIAES